MRIAQSESRPDTISVARQLLVLIATLSLGLTVTACGDDEPDEHSQLGYYWVKSGDNLSGIATRFSVDGGYLRLAELNDLEDANRLRVGQRLQVVYRGSLPDGLQPSPALPWATAERDEMVPCAQLSPWQPEAELPEGGECLASQCASAGDERVCVCQRFERSEGPDGWLSLAANAVLLSGPEGERSVSVPTITGTGRLWVASATFAGGTPYTLISVHLSTSNGIALMDWIHLIVSETGTTSFRSNYPPDTTYMNGGDGGDCDIRVGDFTSATSPFQGPGNYYVERIYRLNAQGLSHQDTFARRHRQAAQWEQWPLPPEVYPGRPTGEYFAIRDASIVDSRGGSQTLQLTLEADSVERSFLAEPWPHHTLSEPDRYWRLGDWEGRFLYPRGYLPPQLGRLLGRSVHLSRARQGSPILWLLD